MNTNVNACRRTLAIYPSRRHFAYVVVEERGLLVDWAVVRLYSTDAQEFLERVDLLLDRYTPASVVFELNVNPRRATRTRQMLDALDRHLAILRLPGLRVSRDRLADAFRNSRSKYDIAEVVTAVWPELRSLLPEKRRVSMAEPEVMALFGAASLLIACTRGAESAGLA